MERDNTIDAIKGIAIILMVMAHAWFPYKNFISLFHMAVFFMVSGYCFDGRKLKDLYSLRSYIFRKLKKIYIPFLFANGIFIMLNNFFIKINFYTINQEYLIWAENNILVNTQFAALGQYNDILHTIKSLFAIVLFAREPQFGGATWFLRVLFIVTVFHAIFEFVFKKNQKLKNIVFVIINILCLIFASIVSYYNVLLPLSLHCVFIAYLCYTFGILLRKMKFMTFKIPSKVILVISFVILAFLSKYYSFSFVNGQIVNIALFIFSSITGYLLLWSFVNVTKYFEKIYVYLGRRTLPILLWHLLSFKLVTYIYLIIKHKPIFLLASFPCLVGVKYLWIAYTLVGIIVPIVFYNFYKKIKDKVIMNYERF